MPEYPLTAYRFVITLDPADAHLWCAGVPGRHLRDLHPGGDSTAGQADDVAQGRHVLPGPPDTAAITERGEELRGATRRHAGQRLPGAYRSPAYWRQLAAANGIVNRAAAAGQVLTVPRLDL